MAQEQGCETIIEEMEGESVSQETLNFLSYFSFLLQNKLVNEKQLALFLKKLEEGKMINIVLHQMTTVGPVFEHSKYQSPYQIFQNYVDNFNLGQNKYEVQIIIDKIKNQLEDLNLIVKQKDETVRSTSLSYALEFVMASSADILMKKLFHLDDIAGDLKKIAPETSALFSDHLSKIDDPKTIVMGLQLRKETLHFFDLAFLESLRDRPDFLTVLPDFLYDDNSDQFRTFVKKLLEKSISNSTKANILKKITNQIEFFETDLYYFLTHAGSSNELYIQSLKMLETLKSKNLQHDLPKLIREQVITHYPPQLIATLFSLNRLGQEFYAFNELLNAANSQSSMHSSYIESFYQNLCEQSPDTCFRYIEWGLIAGNKSIINTSAQTLSTLTSPRALKLKKKLIPHFKDEDKITTALTALQGCDEDWALAFKKKVIANKEQQKIRKEAIISLKHGHTQDSRDYIESLFAGNDQILAMYGISDYRYVVAEALEGRPVEDLLYFFKKDHHVSGSPFTLNALKYLHTFEDDDEVIETAQKMAMGANHAEAMAALNYLKSISTEKTLDLWKKLSQNKDYQIASLQKLYGSTDLETALIFEEALSSSNKNVQLAAFPGYLYLFFYHYEKIHTNSSGYEESRKLIESLKLNSLRKM